MDLPAIACELDEVVNEIGFLSMTYVAVEVAMDEGGTDWPGEVLHSPNTCLNLYIERLREVAKELYKQLK